MAKMRISPELKKLIEKYRCVKDTEGMSPAKVYKLVGENENLYLKMTDSRYKGTTYDVEREKDMMLWLEGKLPVSLIIMYVPREDGALWFLKIPKDTQSPRILHLSFPAKVHILM